jgi:hypothetical protein
VRPHDISLVREGFLPTRQGIGSNNSEYFSCRLCRLVAHPLGRITLTRCVLLEAGLSLNLGYDQRLTPASGEEREYRLERMIIAIEIERLELV